MIDWLIDSIIKHSSKSLGIDYAATTTGAALQALKGHWGLVWAVSFSPGDKFVASASGDRLRDSSTGAALWILEGHLAWVLAVVFSPDRKLVASAPSLKMDLA